MGMTDPVLVVADAGPLIHLDELGALDVLSNYAEVRVPEAVWREVEHHRPTALNDSRVRWVRSQVQAPLLRITAVGTLYTLHRGEQEALTLCLQDAIGVLLTDDTAARLAANSLHLTTHGTLGLLLRAARTGLRTPAEVLRLLEDIPRRSTLHLRPSLLADVLRQVRETWGLVADVEDPPTC
jgi:predicted nucleic acid-binding protein